MYLVAPSAADAVLRANLIRAFLIDAILRVLRFLFLSCSRKLKGMALFIFNFGKNEKYHL